MGNLCAGNRDSPKIDPEEERRADAALRLLAESVGKKGDIFEGVEKNAGGYIETINWGCKGLEEGKLPGEGSAILLDIPTLRRLDIGGHPTLTGDVTKLKVPPSLKILNLNSCGP
eukprot:g5495.t1